MNIDNILEMAYKLEVNTGKKTNSIYCHCVLFIKFWKNITENPYINYCNINSKSIPDWFEYRGIQFIMDNNIILEFEEEKHYENIKDFKLYMKDDDKDEDTLWEQEFEKFLQELEKKDDEEYLKEDVCECGLKAVGDGAPSNRHMKRCPSYVEEE
jgi:hypothetical protein